MRGWLVSYGGSEDLRMKVMCGLQKNDLGVGWWAKEWAEFFWLFYQTNLKKSRNEMKHRLRKPFPIFYFFLRYYSVFVEGFMHVNRNFSIGILKYLYLYVQKAYKE